MSIWNSAIGAMIGFSLGGPIGALLGGVIGSRFDSRKKSKRFSSNQQNQAAFFAALFACLAKLSKADGLVSQEEIEVVDRFIKELTEPKMNWRELLRQQIQSTIKNDYSFQRPSRKGWHTGAILPGMTFDTTIDICIGIDMSGSIGDAQAKVFLSEVQGIMQEYQDYRIKLWCFDTRVYNEADFTADNGSDLEHYEIKGGGGTDFMANWLSLMHI